MRTIACALKRMKMSNDMTMIVVGREEEGGNYRADGTCDHIFVTRMLGILLGCGDRLFWRHF